MPIVRETQPVRKQRRDSQPADETRATQETLSWSQWLQSAPPLPSLPHASGYDDIITPPTTFSQQTRRRRLLFISYEFPPVGGSGVHRPVKLVKYLPEHGWNIEVFTAGHDRFCTTDETLLNELPIEVMTHHIMGYEPACVAKKLSSLVFKFKKRDERNTNSGIGTFGCSDRDFEDSLHWRLTRITQQLGLKESQALWTAPAVRAAIKRHQKIPFDAVISTGPPHFVHCVAMQIVQATGLPWIADVRDPFVSDFDLQPLSKRHQKRMLRLEQDVLDRATAVVVTSPQFARHLRDQYPTHAKKVHTITNGFDRDDIRRAIQPNEIPHNSTDIFTFVAAGAFYGRRELSRIIEPLQRVLDRNPAWADRVQLVIAGTVDAKQRAMHEKKLPAWVSVKGYLEHAEAVRLTATASCNILVVPECQHGQMSIPGKTFELLALPVHILALVPPNSDTASIVQGAGDATVAAFENADDVASAMERIIAARFDSHEHASNTTKRQWTKLDVFDRRSIAATFAKGLNAVMRQEPSNQEPSSQESSGHEP
ncbi:MAG: glycosyltransferase, partial [Phycisphaerae bacterium]|nr:glycosyltransferase [Phycisphaerae bacterium]